MMQDNLPKLNLPPINLSLRRSKGVVQLFDPLRRCYIVLTPEEWVRRHVVGLLISNFGVAQQRVIVEYPVLLNGQRQRADIVVVTNEGEAQLLCECKACDVKISQSTLDQAVRYNSVVGARYIFLTNGLTHHIYEKVDSQGGYRALSSLGEIEL